jgi:transcriptional regulator with XRE-family HTH domain
MSMQQFTPLPPSFVPDMRREVWGRIFGEGIEETRKSAGLSIDEAARLSGMEISEWMAIEQGHVPADLNRLRAMAEALGIRYDQIALMALLCREAWEL